MALLTSGALAQPPAPVLPGWILTRSFPPTADHIASDLSRLTDESLGGRDAGTENEKAAAEWVAQRFREIGLRPAGPEGSWFSQFDFRRFARTARGTTIRGATSRNVLGWLEARSRSAPDAPRPYLLVGAHVDHLGIDFRGRRYPGADDNASGVAGLLAVATALHRSRNRLRHDVLFVAFGAEERGLRGSRHYVKKPARSLDRLRLMINLDMIGRPVFLDYRDLRLAKWLLGIRNGPGVGIISRAEDVALLGLARSALVAEGLPLYTPSDYPLFESRIRDMVRGRADHAPFAEKGIPHLFFSTSEHDDYHRPTDTLEKVDPRIVRRISRAVTRSLLAFDAGFLSRRPLHED